MPKENIDYSNTIFYKLICKDLSIRDCYVGHTTNFVKRKSRHKHNCNTETCNDYNTHVYKFIREHGGWKNWDMVMVEQCECKNRLEAAARERYWYEQLRGTLNTWIPNRDKKEYLEAKREKLGAPFICECGGNYKYSHKSTHFKTEKHQKWLCQQQNNLST